MTVEINLNSAATTELVRTIMNIYLYGTSERPAYFGSHIREQTLTAYEPSTITFNSADFMGESGPGRFVKAAMFDVVQKFFSGVFSHLFSENGVSEFTAAELVAAVDNGDILSPNDFILSLQHVQLEGLMIARIIFGVKITSANLNVSTPETRSTPS